MHPGVTGSRSIWKEAGHQANSNLVWQHLEPIMSQPTSDRRERRRYPVNADVEYRATLGDCEVATGVGATVNLSSRGVLLKTSEPLPCGVRIRLWIAWPIKLNNTVALNLYVIGKTVRTHRGYTAVGICRTEFRTRAASGLI